MATPQWLEREECFAFIHGPTGEGAKGAYELRLDRRRFTQKLLHTPDIWQEMKYILYPVEGCHDALGNPRYVLMPYRRDLSGGCLCLLDMSPKPGGSATLLNVRGAEILGKGVSLNAASSPRLGGARLASETEYPVLLCRPGAQFEWTRSGNLFGQPADFQASWDGSEFRVSSLAWQVDSVAIEHTLEGRRPCRRHYCQLAI